MENLIIFHEIGCQGAWFQLFSICFQFSLTMVKVCWLVQFVNGRLPSKVSAMASCLKVVKKIATCMANILNAMIRCPWKTPGAVLSNFLGDCTGKLFNGQM